MGNSPPASPRRPSFGRVPRPSPTTPEARPLADPRDVAHDKKVHEEKRKQGEEPVPAATEAPQPGMKPHLEPADEKGETYQQHAQQESDAEAE